MAYTIRGMIVADPESVAALQSEAFPARFLLDHLWKPSHLSDHLKLLPEGQWVAALESDVVSTSPNCQISEATWESHQNWEKLGVDLFMSCHDPLGRTLFGVDLAVHPEGRRNGLARQLYLQRFCLERARRLVPYGAVYWLPEYHLVSKSLPVETYIRSVRIGQSRNRTLTPLLKLNMSFYRISRNYMPGPESTTAAAELEWIP